MGHSTHRRTQALRSFGFNIGILVLFVAFSLGGLTVLHDSLVNNADESNAALSRYYASESAGNLTVYETLLDFGATSVETRVSEGNSWAELEAWASSYCDRLRAVLADESLNVYAIIDGQVLTVGEWVDDPTFDVTQREWYRRAVAQPGVTTFSNVYRDAITDKFVVTVAKRCEGVDAVLAFDLYPENFTFQFDMLELPDTTSFFLCDSAGNPLYVRTSMGGDYSDDEVAGYLKELVARIDGGEFSDGDLTRIVDLDSRERAVSYTRMDNGWLAIVTTPYRTIVGGLSWVLTLFAIMVAVFISAVLFMIWRDVRRAARMRRTNDTVRVLGNSYYAIYLVDYRAGTYEMIKGSDYVRDRIAATGAYDDLMRAASEVIEEDTFREFEESFSVDSIRELVQRRVRDYGGDFQRRFGEDYRWVNVRVLYDESLSPDEVVLCFREVDSAKRRQLQERRYLEEALVTAQSSMEEKQAFFNNMSHDMRTPLNAIIGLSDLARRELSDTVKAGRYLERVKRSAEQLLALVNDILDISRMENGKILLVTQRMDLSAVLRDVVEPFGIQARESGKELSLAMDIDRTWVLGDPVRLGQVINNLLSNALKYTERGDAIRVAVEQEGEGDLASYRIRVEDTGIGMSEDYLPHIFEMYAREQRFGAPQAVGTGLGMPITKSLVTQMGGTIEVASKLDEGTVVTVVLPLAAAPDENVGSCCESAAVAAEVPGGEPRCALAGVRILLAEDNEINMEIACEQLAFAGAKVDQAWNGSEAVDAFAASEPGTFDAVLLDMKMPVMDGCEAARAIRALSRPDAARVPIVAVTANAFAEDIAATSAAGMDAHVSKPIDFTLLCTTLHDLLAQRNGEGDER